MYAQCPAQGTFDVKVLELCLLAFLASDGTVRASGTDLVPSGLTDQHGKAISSRDLRDRPTMLFFGFTGCSTICPGTMAAMSTWLKALGADADRLHSYFVTLDPAHDSPAVLAEYLRSFDPHIRGITGSPAQIDLFSREYHAYYQSRSLGDGRRTISHSSGVFLLDADGTIAGLLASDVSPPQAVAELHKLVGQDAARIPR